MPIQVNEDSDGRTLVVEVRGKLTRTDYGEVVPALDTLAGSVQVRGPDKTVHVIGRLADSRIGVARLHIPKDLTAGESADAPTQYEESGV